MIEKKMDDVRSDLVKFEIDGWLLFDYRRSNPLAHRFLEIPHDQMVTRRFFYWIPQIGNPIKIVPFIEPYTLDHLPGIKKTYKGWEELEQILHFITKGNGKIAMEYSPYNALPNISKVDAGTVELIQKWGCRVVSSANLLQRYTSVWTLDQVNSHLKSAEILENIVEKTWKLIEDSLQQGIVLDEYRVQQFMLEEMNESGCQTQDWPTCAVNAHSSDPHYHPTKETACLIFPGDFILLDLWCKEKSQHAVYADITRVGVAASHPTKKQEEIFNVVKGARDAATAMIKDEYEHDRPIEGWQVDRVCRNYICDAGFGDYFIHRTGHNIGEEVHGSGANLDDFETHDFRQLLAGTGFSVEPGIYLPGEFGIRLEYDIYLDPAGKMRITGGVQEKLKCLNVS
ncbi:MAG: M24 family metallopeptidase [Parachlamydiaceae bacterium]